MNKTLIALVFLVLLAGCSSQQAAPQQRGPGGRGRGFGNMTDEQRQQMAQVMTSACNGKTVGDACVIPSPRGERNGTCEQRNETLWCAGMRQNGGQYPGQNQNWQRPPQE
jgi:hypothetical protein